MNYWILRKQDEEEILERLMDGETPWHIRMKIYTDGRRGKPDNIDNLKKGDKIVVYFVEGAGVFYGTGVFFGKKPRDDGYELEFRRESNVRGFDRFPEPKQLALFEKELKWNSHARASIQRIRKKDYDTIVSWKGPKKAWASSQGLKYRIKTENLESSTHKRIANEQAQEMENFSNDIENNEVDTPKKRKAVRYIIQRNSKKAKELKNLYESKCQICTKISFPKKDGENYSEAHHLIPLGKDGSNSYKNLVILCPTCHKKLHFAKVSFRGKKGNKAIVFINDKRMTVKYDRRHFQAISELNTG